MIDPVIRDLTKYEAEMDHEDYIYDELWSLAETPDGEGMTRAVPFFCVGIDEEPEADEIIARLAGLSMLEESFFADAYDMAGGK